MPPSSPDLPHQAKRKTRTPKNHWLEGESRLKLPRSKALANRAPGFGDRPKNSRSDLRDCRHADIMVSPTQCSCKNPLNSYASIVDPSDDKDTVAAASPAACGFGLQFLCDQEDPGEFQTGYWVANASHGFNRISISLTYLFNQLPTLRLAMLMSTEPCIQSASVQWDDRGRQ